MDRATATEFSREAQELSIRAMALDITIKAASVAGRDIEGTDVLIASAKKVEAYLKGEQG